MYRIVILLISIVLVENSVIRKEGEKAQSLYDANDKVIVLTHENFYQSVFDQPYASNVEFYNSFCGFCRNFAPIYKSWANDVYDWHGILNIAAIDCADDGNNDICRDMEIMKYPTLKYFPPYYKNETNNLGIEVQHVPMTVGEPNLLELLANVTTITTAWPNLKPINSTTQAALFASLPIHIDYVFIVRDSKDDLMIAQKVALDLHTINSIEIRPISTKIATMLGLHVPLAIYVVTKNTKSIDMIKHLTEFNRETVRTVIEEYLKSKGLEKIRNLDETSILPDGKVHNDNHDISVEDTAIIEYVKAHPDVVYQSDLEMAIRTSIFHELVKYNNMNDEQIAALKRYLSVLQKYVNSRFFYLFFELLFYSQNLLGF